MAKVVEKYIKELLLLADNVVRQIPVDYTMDWKNLQLILAEGTSKINAVATAVRKWTTDRILEHEPEFPMEHLNVLCSLIVMCNQFVGSSSKPRPGYCKWCSHLSGFPDGLISL